MANSLELSSFLPLSPIIDSRKEWDSRIGQDMDTLDSLATIASQRKYYFYERDGKFYPSNWALAIHLKEWIGEWAVELLTRGEEIAYRKLWGLSVSDSIVGLLSIKSRIVETVAIASRTLELNDHEFAIDIPTLEHQILAIQQKLSDAKNGLANLQATYSSASAKQRALEYVVEDVVKELQRFVCETLAKINERKKDPNERSNTTVAAIITAATSDAEGKEPLPPLPFAFPKGETQNAFNASYAAHFLLMQNYRKTHVQDQTDVREKFERFKGRSAEMPWTVLVTAEGRTYYHYHISIVPKGKGGINKTDKLAFGVFQSAHVAKLTTKMFTPLIEEMAKREEAILRLCTTKKLPNIVELYDVIWKSGNIRKQVMYLKFYSHGDLKNSLSRIRQDPGKKKKVLLGILRGLAALHAEKIVHLDIKPANIFLDENDEPYIGDFGYADFEDQEGHLRGSPFYMDPFYLSTKNGKASPCNDIWSFGMIMYGMLIKNEDINPWPWLQDATTVCQVKILNERVKDMYFHEPLDDVWMHACWEALQVDPTKRSTAQQLRNCLEHA